VTEVYANKPSTVLVHTRDNPEFVITHGTFYPTDNPFIYESYHGGHWLSSFGSTKSFRQSAVGTYTARIYVDADNKVTENGIDNQRKVTYKISNSWPQPVINPSAIDAIVNKKYVLPSSYYPNDLVQVNFNNNGQPLRWVAANAMNSMRAAAASQGVYMRLISGFRSYQTQVDTYNYWVQQDGQAAADQASARPGHSEHQLGLAADLSDENNTGCDLYACFADTAAGRWLAAYAQNYGFIIRYPYGKESITGYEYEPWHVRYVGVSLAKAIKASGLTMEQYFHVPGGNY
jgi:D-alanyl-D-alanine carboxypeptidase